MTEQTTARVAPAAESALLTEHVNVLMSPDTRAFLLGSKLTDEARSEGAVARALLEDSISIYAGRWPEKYAERVALGRAELARRAA